MLIITDLISYVFASNERKQRESKYREIGCTVHGTLYIHVSTFWIEYSTTSHPWSAATHGIEALREPFLSARVLACSIR
jgi:hypothetical protein